MDNKQLTKKGGQMANHNLPQDILQKVKFMWGDAKFVGSYESKEEYYKKISEIENVSIEEAEYIGDDDMGFITSNITGKLYAFYLNCQPDVFERVSGLYGNGGANV